MDAEDEKKLFWFETVEWGRRQATLRFSNLSLSSSPCEPISHQTPEQQSAGKEPGEENRLDEAVQADPRSRRPSRSNARVQRRFTGHIALRGEVSDAPSLYSSPEQTAPAAGEKSH